MEFYLPEDYQAECWQNFERFKEKILNLLPQAKVEHIGSSAMVGLISKGDLDIYVEVNASEIDQAILLLQSLDFFEKKDTLRTRHLCMLEHTTENCAIQLVAANSEFTFFLKFRDALIESSRLCAQYNLLKQQSLDCSEDDYRQRKSLFIQYVLNQLNLQRQYKPIELKMKDSEYLTELICQYEQNPNLKFLHFWGHTPKQAGQIDKSCFSQWYPISFVVDGIEYKTAEHYMMAQKSKLFNDEDNFAKILQANTPNDAKKLGRLVKNYDGLLWEQHRFEIVVQGNIAKFSQHQALKDFLLGTSQRVLVEASPVDQIWGIGFAEQDQQANDPTQWKGLNLLGFALMKVREKLNHEN